MSQPNPLQHYQDQLIQALRERDFSPVVMNTLHDDPRDEPGLHALYVCPVCGICSRPDCCLTCEVAR